MFQLLCLTPMYFQTISLPPPYKMKIKKMQFPLNFISNRDIKIGKQCMTILLHGKI